MFGLFNPPKGQPYRGGYRIDAFPDGANWRGWIYDRQGNARRDDFSASTRAKAIDRAREIVDGLIALERQSLRG